MMAYLRLVVKVSQKAPERLSNLMDAAESEEFEFAEAEETKSSEDSKLAMTVELQALKIYKKVLILQITH